VCTERAKNDTERGGERAQHDKKFGGRRHRPILPTVAQSAAMDLRTKIDIDEFAHWIGREVAVSDWLTITQDRIDQFANAAGDHQWIHVDRDRAARESPFKTTIAHGFLTLAVLSQLLGDSIEVVGKRMGVNYGLNRVRFTSPVLAGARVRARFLLVALETIDGGVQTTWGVTVEQAGSDKPALVAEWLTRHYR
jgi:acyl dehydratase